MRERLSITTRYRTTMEMETTLVGGHKFRAFNFIAYTFITNTFFMHSPLLFVLKEGVNITS